MQRELKFRVFDNVDYMTTFTIDDVIQNKIVFTSDCPIMQYTGLKDKNGVEIYEGDMYEVANNKIYQVRYSEGDTFNHEWYGGCFILWNRKNLHFPFDEFAMAHGKVIGNIYQNTELIQEEETNN